jgi:hypothetical protein
MKVYCEKDALPQNIRLVLALDDFIIPNYTFVSGFTLSASQVFLITRSKYMLISQNNI